MSTPTPSQTNAQPSPIPKKAAHNNVSTPSHPSHSPAPPRSVSSPSTTRKDQSGKTPANHPTSSSFTSNKTLAGTPMLASLSQQGSTASPSGPLPFTPTGLGVDLGTPSAHMISTPSLGMGMGMGMGIGMVPSMSELGLTSTRRNEDDERRAKLRAVLKTIGRPRGRVGEEGIARASRRVGFANDIDAEKLSNEERERRVGNRTVSIAGNTIVIDVELRQHVPRAVQVLFSSEMAGAADGAEKAGKVLLQDLTAGDERGCGLNASLDRFAANLERLARIDRLSSSRISAFDAISGVYAAFKRLYEREVVLAREAGKEHAATVRRRAEMEVMCERSGFPAMHDRGRLGLSLQYWADERYGHGSKQVDDGAMDIDDASPPQEKRELTDHSVDNTYKLHIEVERCPSDVYQAIRVSDAWLPDPLELLRPASDTPATIIPWQDPPPTFLAAESDGLGDSMTDEATQPKKLPDLRFVAKLDPPLVLPWQTAANVLSAVGSTPPQAYHMHPYHTLVLGLPTPIAAETGDLISTERNVYVPHDREFVDVKHAYKLSVTAKNELGFKLEELPFSHPRQLVELLPTLRQWACVNSLLTRTFAGSTETSTSTAADVVAVSLDDLLADASLANAGVAPIEVSLATTPVPTLGMSFPIDGGDAVFTADIQVLPNGDLHVATDDSLKASDAAKALDVCNDLGLWVEWLKSSRSSSTAEPLGAT